MDGEGQQRELTASVDEAMALAVALHRSHRLEEAEGIYTKVLERDPAQVDALHFLGVLRHSQDRSEEAVDLIRRALEAAPDYTDARSNLGNVLREMKRLDEAEREYRAVLETDPRHADAWNNLGTIRARRDDREGATAAYRKVLDIDPDHPDAWQNLGNEYRRAGRYDQAVEAYERALRLRPDRAQLYLNLGRAYYVDGHTEKAVAVYSAWAAREPENPIARHMLAACGGGQAPKRASDAFVTRTFDAFSVDFDEVLARLDYRAPNLVEEAVRQAFPPGRKDLSVLDAGCGTGLCGPLLRPFAASLTGVDLSDGMLRRARKRKVYDELVAAELTRFLLDHPAAFDLIASADVFVYFGDLGDLLRATAGALRPGGRLVFTTERVEDADAPGGYLLHPHGRYGHAESYLDRALRAAGLAPLSLTRAELRLEGGEPVEGILAVAGPGAPGSPPPAPL